VMWRVLNAGTYSGRASMLQAPDECRGERIIADFAGLCTKCKDDPEKGSEQRWVVRIGDTKERVREVEVGVFFDGLASTAVFFFPG